jgi:Type VI secretion system effector, Hcp
MSDETKKENAIPAKDSQEQAPELSNDDLDKAVGGAALSFGDIKGESQESNHQDWIEIFSFSNSVTQSKP